MIAEYFAASSHAGYSLEGRMRLAILKPGRAIDAVGYGCTRPGANANEHCLPTPAE